MSEYRIDFAALANGPAGTLTEPQVLFRQACDLYHILRIADAAMIEAAEHHLSSHGLLEISQWASDGLLTIAAEIKAQQDVQAMDSPL